MSLLGIIETLRRNLKAVVVGCWIVLTLVVVADIVRWATASGGHEAGASEHAAAPSSAHTVATVTEHSSHTVAPSEHAAPAEHGSVLKSEISDHKAAAHGAAPAAHGFWASAYHIAETKPVFWTLFGFLGCVLIVVVSKTYGHFGVSVREDYYSE